MMVSNCALRRGLTSGPRTGFLIAVFSSVLLFSGCGPAPETEATSGYTIATVVKVDGIAWFEQMREGVERFGKETGHTTFLLGPAKADAAEQVQIIEGLIAQQVDALCVVPISVEALEPVLKKARDKGIVVVSHEASSQVNADLIIEPFDNAAFGRHLMDHLARAMGEEGDYATFVGSLTSKSHNEWVDAAVAHQRETYPRMNLVANKIEDYDDQNVAYQKAKELMTAYPGLKGIQTSAMPAVPGVALAIEERGLQDKISLVGTSLVSVSEPYLKSGAAKLISFWDPAEAGYVMNRLAVGLLKGEPTTGGMDLGVDGYRQLTVSPSKTNLFYGSAWIDVTGATLTENPSP